MEKIEGLSLPELLQQTAATVLEDQRKGVVGFIKQLFQDEANARATIDNLERELDQKRKQLASVQQKIEKIREDDWSVINLGKLKNDKE
jgi:uncharacterized protein HemX